MLAPTVKMNAKQQFILMTTKEEKKSEEMKGCKTETQKKECKPSGSCKSSEKKS